MSDKDDLRELREVTKDNDEAEYVPEEDMRDFDAPDPLLDPYDYDEEPGTLKENARLWAKVGDAYFPADQTVNRLAPGQYSIEYSQSRHLLCAQAN